MSITKVQATQYHEEEQSVKFGLKWLRLDNLDELTELSIGGGFSGRVGNAMGEVDSCDSGMGLQVIKNNFSTAEKQAGKLFLAACERELAKEQVQLKDESHDGSDIFVVPTGE